MDEFQAPSVAAAMPIVQGRRQVTFGSEKTNTQVTGITPEYISCPQFLPNGR